MLTIRQIQVGWKGRDDIMKTLMEKVTLLEDWNSSIFFKVSDAIKELEGPPLIKDSMLISPNELNVELSKLKGKWVAEFDDLSNFF